MYLLWSVEGRLSGFNNSGGDAPSFLLRGEKGVRRIIREWNRVVVQLRTRFLAGKSDVTGFFFFAPKTRSIVSLKETSKSFLFFLIPIVLLRSIRNWFHNVKLRCLFESIQSIVIFREKLTKCSCRIKMFMQDKEKLLGSYAIILSSEIEF